MAVNGIRKDYTEVLDDRKGESIIKKIGCLHAKKGEIDSEGTGKQKGKRARKVKK